MYTNRKLTPVQRKPREPKTITKKLRTKKLSKTVEDKGWTNSDIDQTYTK